MNYWLMKTEPSTFSFDDLMKAPKKTTTWDGVRNFQARNFMQAMKVGDKVIIYHSSAEPPGAAGIAEVAREAAPDETAFDARDDHYDPDSSRDAPRWFCVAVKGVEKFDRLVSLEELRANPALKDMRLLQRGNRLSVLPVTAAEFKEIGAMAKRKPR